MTDATIYTPTTEPGARLPHWWLADGSSLYDHLGHGFTLVCPQPDDARDGSDGGDALATEAAVAALRQRARDRRIPLTVLHPPPSYPWADEFLLVRPDQHIAWRAGNPYDIDIEAAVGHRVDVPRHPHSAIA
jgi:hypothetical protein